MTKKKIIENIVAPIGIVILSIVFAIIFHDFTLGFVTLLVGFLNAYYMALGKWYNYIFGILFSIFYSIACAINGLFGFAIFSVILYTPIQIVGIVNWFRKQENGEVLVNSLSIKKGIITIALAVSGSFLVGILLSIIPRQTMPYFDAVSQILNLLGIVFTIFRYRESWILFLFNNVIDLVIWIIKFVKHTEYSSMMLVVAIMYLVMNIYGIVYWIFIEGKQKNKAKTVL